MRLVFLARLCIFIISYVSILGPARADEPSKHASCFVPSQSASLTNRSVTSTRFPLLGSLFYSFQTLVSTLQFSSHRRRPHHRPARTRQDPRHAGAGQRPSRRPRVLESAGRIGRRRRPPQGQSRARQDAVDSRQFRVARLAASSDADAYAGAAWCIGSSDSDCRLFSLAIPAARQRPIGF